MSIFKTKYQKYCLGGERMHHNNCSIRFIMTNICNMTCWYCTFNYRASKRDPIRSDDILWKKILKFIS